MPIASSEAKCGRARRMLSSSAAVSAGRGWALARDRRGGEVEAELTDVPIGDDENVSLGRQRVENCGVMLRRDRE